MIFSKICRTCKGPPSQSILFRPAEEVIQPTHVLNITSTNSNHHTWAFLPFHKWIATCRTLPNICFLCCLEVKQFQPVHGHYITCLVAILIIATLLVVYWKNISLQPLSLTNHNMIPWWTCIGFYDFWLFYDDDDDHNYYYHHHHHSSSSSNIISKSSIY